LFTAAGTGTSVGLHVGSGKVLKIGGSIDTDASTALTVKTVGTTAVTIDTSQNVGIGTSSPNTKLDVNSGTLGYALTLQAATDTSRKYQLGIQSNGLSFYDTTAAAVRMVIDTSGNLLVGATASANSTYSVATFRGSTKGIAIQDSSTGNYRAIYPQAGALFFYNGTNEGYLSSAGAWINASDAKLKNSIVDIKYGLTALMNTQPRSYKMNDLDGDYVGFVAQELQEVIPEVVSGDPEKQLGVDYGSLVAVAFKAIQEQQAIITQLQADVAALKAK
jgi:hypothetical protein